MRAHRLKAYLLLFIVAVIWGIASPVIKITLHDLSADLFIFYRFLISSIIAIPFLIKYHPSAKKLMSSSIDIVVYCLLTSVLALGFLFLGMEKTTVLNASLIQTLGPLIVSFFGYKFLHDHITHKEKRGLFIAFLGSLVVYLELVLHKNGGLGLFGGNLLIFAYLIANAFGSVYLKKLLRMDLNPIFLSNLSFLLGFIFFIPVVILKYHYTFVVDTLFTLPLNSWLGILYMAVFSGTLAYTLGNYAQKSLEISETALFSYLQPVFSSILAIVWLGEVPSLYFFAGAVVIILGVIIAEIKFKY